MDFSGFTADGVQQDNIAGILRFWKVITKAFTGEFPAKAHVVNGEVTADPLAFLPQYFVPAEYVVPNDTKSFDYELLGTDGSENWKHLVGYEKAGFSAAMVAEMMKDQNARSVFFMEDTDGNIVVVGTSVKGLRVTTKGGTGKQGGEKRGAVMIGEEVGYRWAPVPLSAAVRNDFLIRQAGYGPFFQRNVYLNYTFTVGSTKTLQFGDESGKLLPELYDNQYGYRAGVAWKEGDTVLITHGILGSPRLSKSLKDGWCKAEITSFNANGFADFSVLEACVAGASAGFASNFVVFHKDRPKFTGLTRVEEPTDGYFGPMAFGYTGGTLPYKSGDNVFIQYCTGSAPVIKVSGVFVSQVGTTVNITVSVCEVLFIGGTLAATTGYEIMENVVYV